jgi:monoamine oxidase
MYDVIIIGGGSAGLMAAKILSEAGKNILLLEARAQLGGRIQAIDTLTYSAEGGAEFIHGDLKATFDLLNEAGIQKDEVQGSFCRFEKGHWLTENNEAAGWNLLTSKLNSCKKDLTVNDFLENYFSDEKYAAIKNQFRNYIEGYDAADPRDANIFAIREEMNNEEEKQYRPKNGYPALIQYLKNICIKNNAAIKTKEPVKEIRKSDLIEIITTTAQYEAKKIIIAVPLGVLQCEKNCASFIKLPDNLHAYTQAAKSIGNGGVIKFLIEFERDFWLDKEFLKTRNIPAPSYIFSDQKIPTWWTQYPSRKPLLTGWVAGPKSITMKNYSSEKFKMLALDSLASLFDLPVDHLDKILLECKVMNWIQEPHILGSYSYSTLETSAARAVFQMPFENAIYFAGEYVAEGSTATVDAALSSGKKVAEQILKEGVF